MATAIEDRGLDALLGQIVPGLDPEAVYLFGSRARGDPGEDSDYDLLVILPDSAPKERLSIDGAYRLARAARVTADVVLCRRSGFEDAKNRVGTLSYEAYNFGRRVYGR